MELTWTIELFGEFRVQSREGAFVHCRTQKARSLLAYLAYYAGRSHSREVLAEMFWPNSDPEAGRLSLRVELSCLRRLLEPSSCRRGDVLIAGHHCVQINPRFARTDASQFEEACQAADRAADASERLAHLHQVVEIYRNGFLPGWYEEWVLQEQERLADLYLNALLQSGSLLEAKGELEAAMDCAHRAIAASPLCEPAHADLIRRYRMVGRRADAMRQYRLLEQRLREELDTLPTEETRSYAFGPVLPAEMSSSSARVSAPSTLPLVGTRFLGREREIGLLLAHLGEESDSATRLITLLGTGGSGKTRLAIEAARQMEKSEGAAFWFVPLADIDRAESILPRIAQILRLPDAEESDLLHQVAAALNRPGSLLILDNFEHLEGGGQEIVSALLQNAERLRCLITSRHRLGISCEYEIPVPPLPIPEPEAATLDEWMACESVQLFLDRAGASRPDFQMTTSNAADILAICRRLDGLPLGIELVASWARMMTPTQMLAQLEAGASFVSRAQNISPRHASVNAAIEWSWRRLGVPLQTFLTRLSVFRGSWSLKAAEAVCETPNVVDQVAALLDRSWIVAEESAGEMRFRLLEPLREFASERMGGGEQARRKQIHAAYHLELAEQEAPYLDGARRRSTAERLRCDHGNFIAALAYLEGSEEGVRLAVALTGLWMWEGRVAEAEAQVLRMLTAGKDLPPQQRANGLFVGAAIMLMRGETTRARELYLEGERSCAQVELSSVWPGIRALSHPNLLLVAADSSEDMGGFLPLLRRAEADNQVRAFLLGRTGKLVSFPGDYAAGSTYFEESQVLYSAAGNLLGSAVLLYQRGEFALRQGHYAEATHLCQQSLAVYRELDEQVGIAKVTNTLGFLARLQSDYSRAEALARESIALSRRFGWRSNLGSGLWLFGTIVLFLGDYENACRALEESLELRREIGSGWAIADTLSALGTVAYMQGDYKQARTLYTQSLALRRAGPDRLDVMYSLYELGAVALEEGLFAEAESLLQESLQIRREMQDQASMARELFKLALTACRSGAVEVAEERLREGLMLQSHGTSLAYIAEGLETASELRFRQGRLEIAATLRAGAESMRKRIGAPLPPKDRSRWNKEGLALSSSLGKKRLAACCAAGSVMTPDEAIAYAVGESA